jgi:hypothetical protein
VLSLKPRSSDMEWAFQRNEAAGAVRYLRDAKGIHRIAAAIGK